MEQRSLVSFRVGNDIRMSPDFRKEIIMAIKRFNACDWGNISDDAADANEYAELYGGTIVGYYHTHLGGIYIIITDALAMPLEITVLYENEL